MGATHHPQRSGGTISVTVSTLLVAVALVGGVFTMLVAASYPGAVTGVTMSATFAAALGEGWNRVTLSYGRS